MTDIILDLDTGIDDSIALFLASIDPSLNLVGVLTSYGNVTTEEALRNSLDILFLAGRTDTAVFYGKENSLREGGKLCPLCGIETHSRPERSRRCDSSSFSATRGEEGRG